MSVRPIGGSLVVGDEMRSAGRGEPRERSPPQSRGGRRCVAVTSDSRASCRRRRRLRHGRRRYADGVFYDRVAAALQGLGGRVLETPQSFFVVTRTKQWLYETYLGPHAGLYSPEIPLSYFKIL